MSRHSAISLILLSALCFGGMALFAKMAYAEGATPSILLALRFAMGVAILAPVVWWRGLHLPRGKVLGGLILMGILYTAQSQSFFTALVYASSGLVALLLYLYPVLVTILAVCLGWEKLNVRTCVLLALALVGMAVMLGDNLSGQPLGVVLGLAAAGVYAIYLVIGGRMNVKTDPLVATFVIMAVAMAGNGTVAVARDAALPATPVAWLAIMAIACLSVVAVTCLLVGIRAIGASQAAIISTAEPVITVCLGVALLEESISAGQMAGGAMVLAAVVLLALRPRARLTAG